MKKKPARRPGASSATPRKPAARMAAEAIRRPELIDELVAACRAPRGAGRLMAASALCLVAERAPAMLYPYFDYFTGMLDSENSILRWNAIRAIGRLAAADKESRIEKVLDRYLAPIQGPQMIAASNVIAGAAFIARAKPHLAGHLASAILAVEKADYATAECRNVAIGHALDSLDRIFDLLPDPRPAVAFASRQLANPRAGARRKAEAFLKGRGAPRAAAKA